MRQIGTLPTEAAARTFEDFLLTRGMRSNVEPAGDEWAVWIFDEDDVEQARQELAEFHENPDAPRFTEGAQAAGELRRQEEKQRKRDRKNVVSMRERWNRPMTARIPLTMALIIVSVLVTFGCDFGERVDPIVTWLGFTRFIDRGDGRWYFVQEASAFKQIASGQIWRLVTPIFIHLGYLHLFSNMYVTFLLGSMVEIRRGAARYAGLVLVIAVFSNLGQVLTWGPTFGGISGVGYGIFGYLWTKSRYEPESGFYLPPNIVFLMIAWFVVCFTGAVGPIANTAHGVGLMTGMVIGYWRTFLKNLQGR